MNSFDLHHGFKLILPSRVGYNEGQGLTQISECEVREKQGNEGFEPQKIVLFGVQILDNASRTTINFTVMFCHKLFTRNPKILDQTGPM